MIKDVAFDFWQIETPRDLPTFTDILTQTAAIGDLSKRVVNVGGRTLRFETLKLESRLFLGDLIKLRMDELPGVASASTPRRDLNLQNDQGITEETAFGYDTRTGVLIAQRNFYGASPSVIVEYFRSLANYQGVIQSHPIVSEEGFARLQSMHSIKKMSFRVARPQRGAIARASTASVGSAIGILDDLSAMQVEMGISVGRYDSVLSKARVISVIRDLLRLHENNAEAVEKVVVSGKAEDETRDVFDLLEYRVRSQQTIPIDPARRTMTSASRLNAVVRAFRERGNELEALVG